MAVFKSQSIPKKIQLGQKTYNVLKYDGKKKALLVSLESIKLPELIGKLTGRKITIPICSEPFYLEYPVLNQFVKTNEIY